MVEAVLNEARLLASESVEARLAAADPDAEREATEVALEFRGVQGDANRAEERRSAVADLATGE